MNSKQRFSTRGLDPKDLERETFWQKLVISILFLSAISVLIAIG
jgi:hypothetical protein